MSIVNMSHSKIKIFDNEDITFDSIGKVYFEDKNSKYLNKRGFFNNKNLHLIILPTEKCNFRCTYCYEDFKVGKISKATIAGVKALLDSRCLDLRNISISWFGGEPLTAKNEVIDISKYVMSLVYRYPQLNYQGDMTTNGYLLDHKTVTALSNVGVREFQISLDGHKEVHDQSRLRADGEGTYDRIWNNLLAIRNSSLPVSIMLRLHFTVDTIELIDPLLENIKKEFLPDPRFSIFFKAIEKLGGANDAYIKTFSEKEKEKALNSLKAKLFGGNINHPQNYSLPEHPVCYASRPNSLVIRANGDVGKCTVALKDERNKVATLQPDGTLQLISGRLDPWLRGIKTLEPEDLTCPLVNLPPMKETNFKLKEKALENV